MFKSGAFKRDKAILEDSGVLPALLRNPAHSSIGFFRMQGVDARTVVWGLGFLPGSHINTIEVKHVLGCTRGLPERLVEVLSMDTVRLRWLQVC